MITLLGYPHILGNLHMFRVQNLFSVSARFFVSLMSAGLYKPAWQGGSCLSQKSFPTESWINVIHMGFYHQEWWIKHEPLGYLVCKWMDLRNSKTETPGKPVFFLCMFFLAFVSGLLCHSLVPLRFVSCLLLSSYLLAASIGAACWVERGTTPA